MATCLDYGIDYPHSEVHCPACWDRVIEQNKLKAMNRANELKEKELNMREEGVWVDKPVSPPRKVHYELPRKQALKGGIKIESITDSNRQ